MKRERENGKHDNKKNKIKERGERKKESDRC